MAAREVTEAIGKAGGRLGFRGAPLAHAGARGAGRASQPRLAARGPHHIHFTCGGSEGIEAAVKIALQHYAAQGRADRVKIMSREVSYHGTTIAMAGLSGHQSRKRGLEGFLQTFPRIRRPRRCAARWAAPPDAGRYYLEATRAAIEAEGPASVAAFVAEPVTGSRGGAIVPPATTCPASGPSATNSASS